MVFGGIQDRGIPDLENRKLWLSFPNGATTFGEMTTFGGSLYYFSIRRFELHQRMNTPSAP
jgi:hypothetical protein